MFLAKVYTSTCSYLQIRRKHLDKLELNTNCLWLCNQCMSVCVNCIKNLKTKRHVTLRSSKEADVFHYDMRNKKFEYKHKWKSTKIKAKSSPNWQHWAPSCGSKTKKVRLIEFLCRSRVVGHGDDSSLAISSNVKQSDELSNNSLRERWQQLYSTVFIVCLCVNSTPLFTFSVVQCTCVSNVL